MHGFVQIPERGFLEISGPDRFTFLNGLVSNLVTPDAPVYAALFTPQGKFLHDFFVIPHAECLLIDAEATRLDDLLERLLKYKLRSKVELRNVSANYAVYAAWGTAAGYADPRHSSMGQRILVAAGATPDFALPELTIADYQRQRLACLLPDSSRDIEPERGLPLEHNLDIANAISFTKGCYIGQELTARMRYRDLLKKRLVLVTFPTTLPPPHTPLYSGPNEAGELRTGLGQQALALVRLEYKDKPLICADMPVQIEWPTEKA